MSISQSTERKILSRRKFIFLAAGTSALALLEESFPRIPYETDPYNFRDSTVWRLLRGPFGGIMRLCGAGDKDSNYWQWQETELPKIRPSAVLRGNFDTFVRNGTADNVKMSCDGIHEVYQLKPPNDSAWKLAFQTVHMTDTGLYAPYQPKPVMFSGILRGDVKFMRGNGDVLIYAFDRSGERLRLSVNGPYSREDSSVPGQLI